MPFKSEAQRRFMFAVMPKTAARWAKHTDKGKKLPEHVSSAKKEAAGATAQPTMEEFVRQFLQHCETRQLNMKQAAELAQLLRIQQLSPDKQANDTVTGLLNLLKDIPYAGFMLGSVTLPTVGGFLGGSYLGKLQNLADDSSSKTLRDIALAKAYRRRADEQKIKRDLSKLQTSGTPGQYVLLS